MPAVASATMKTAAATVESSTAMEPTIAVEPASTMEAAAVFKAFMRESSASKTVMVPATAAETAASIKPAAIVSTTVEAAAIKARAPIKSVKPGARADEHVTNKPFRAVVTVRRAGVRVIIIIAVGAYWCGSIIGWPDSDAHNHSLRARKRRAKEANAE